MKTDSTVKPGISIIEPRPGQELRSWFPKIVPIYKAVFGDEIWCEGYKCSRCGRKYAFSAPSIANGFCCEVKLQEYYADGDIVRMLESLLLRRYQLRLALDSAERVVGFQWGWVDSLSGMNDKLDLFPAKLLELEASLKAQGLFSTTMYYWAESGVINEFRRQGLATAMYASIRQSLVRQGVRNKILRTTRSSPQYRLSTQMGDTEVFNYMDNTLDRRTFDQRILLAGGI
ncbi:MAG: hypothetical protein HY817_05855 [Candidatus Abawacabacteria bacterium]|nr:hypothetical protein [Candidatus Abawacabacteria bacterium]